MTHPYETPFTGPPPLDPDRRRFVALIPFRIAVPAIIAATFLWFARPLPPVSNAIVFGVVATLLVFDLPVCIMVTVQWLAAGEPPELSLYPLTSSRGEREFARFLRERPQLSDENFYHQFYARSGISEDIVRHLRAFLRNQLGSGIDGLHPQDNLCYASEELDWYDLIVELNDEFEVEIDSDKLLSLGTTFDSLVQGITSAKPRSIDVRGFCHRGR